MSGPVWVTPAGFLGTLSERRTISIPVVATGTGITYSLISGSLPTGVYLNPNTGLLLGNYQLRAETDILLSGNTLKYYIADNQGQLPPGLTLSQNGTIQGYVKDNLILDSDASINGGYDTEAYDQYPYEHNAIDLNELDSSNVFAQFDIINIALSNPCVVFVNGNHNLVDGRLIYLRNLTEPSELNGNGYYAKVNSSNSIALFSDQNLTTPVSSIGLDVYTEGGELVWGSASLGRPGFINKTYQFYVTVTDGIASTQRLFTIDVVDRNSLRVDNTLLSVDSEYIDSSAGYLLAPIWQSKYGDKLPNVYNLGSVRANREQILTVYDYDPYPTDGPTIFNWTTLTVNPDIRLTADSRVGVTNIATQNLRSQNSIYFKDAEIIPVKGMQIRLSEYISGSDPITYTVTGVIRLSDSSGVINIDQPLSQSIPDNSVFYVGTPSRRPAGLDLDPISGNIYGKLLYQPTYSESYRFTVQVVKINQQTADTTIFEAIESNDARIVGKRYFEGLTVSTTATMTSVVVDNLISEAKDQLPDPLTYTGIIGDIILVGISDNVIYNDLLAVMGGTTYAFIYSDTDSNPRWEYVGETITSSQIYILNVLGEVFSSIQWISTGSIGSIRSGEISELAVKAINTNTNYSITYELISGQLPDGLVLRSDGSIQGKIKNTGQTYFDFGTTTATFVGSISQNVLTVDTVTNGTIVPHQYITTTATNPGLVADTFVISGSGNTWIVNNHTTSTTYDVVSSTTTVIGTETTIIITTTTITTSSITLSTASFSATTLSPNAFDEEILTIDTGATTTDQNYYFTIRASDAYRLSAVDREFYITVVADTLTEYTRIYVKPFLTRDKRNSYRDFVTDSLIFDPVLIYRPFDPEFGIQTQIKMLLETGIEKVNLDLYAEAMTEYFYRKRFYFGEVKSILAQDSDGNNVYEIIYVDIIDDQMMGSDRVGVSVDNMRSQLESIVIDGDTILVDERLQPKYMTTLDVDTGIPLGFVKAVPICYTIPGGALKILSRINNAIKTGQFNFNNYNFDTDRIVVETVKETEQTGWLAYPTERQ
jgi:hypothetical protein